MPIMSYLATAAPGRYQAMVDALSRLPECELHQPENRTDVVVLVTDTTDEAAEKHLRKQLDAIESLLCLAMVFGHRVDSSEGVAP